MVQLLHPVWRSKSPLFPLFFLEPFPFLRNGSFFRAELLGFFSVLPQSRLFPRTYLMVFLFLLASYHLILDFCLGSDLRCLRSLCKKGFDLRTRGRIGAVHLVGWLPFGQAWVFAPSFLFPLVREFFLG